MPTARDIITLALKEAGVLGVGRTPSAEDANDSLILLNNMLAVWQRHRWLVPWLTDVAKQADGSLSYTVGLGGDINIHRPDKIESAYVRQVVMSQPNRIDYPLTLIHSYEDYSRIALKSLNSFPSYAFYDAAFPFGNLHIYPVPSLLYEIHIVVKAPMINFTTLDVDFAYPPEYAEAIHYNLSARLRSMYKRPPDATILALARSSLATIRTANSQISTLKMPKNLSRPSIYNVYSDRSY